MISNAGSFSLYNGASDNGTSLDDLAVTRNVVIGSMMFPHTKCKETWVSPDGLTRNQIAHKMIDARHILDIIDVRHYRGANCDSDQFMVKIKYRPKIEIMNKSPGGRNMKFNTQKFKDGPIFKVCQWTIEDRVDNQNVYDQNDVDQDGCLSNRAYMQLQKKQLELLNQKEETSGLMKMAIK